MVGPCAPQEKRPSLSTRVLRMSRCVESYSAHSMTSQRSSGFPCMATRQATDLAKRGLRRRRHSLRSTTKLLRASLADVEARAQRSSPPISSLPFEVSIKRPPVPVGRLRQMEELTLPASSAGAVLSNRDGSRVHRTQPLLDHSIQKRGLCRSPRRTYLQASDFNLLRPSAIPGLWPRPLQRTSLTRPW